MTPTLQIIKDLIQPIIQDLYTILEIHGMIVIQRCYNGRGLAIPTLLWRAHCNITVQQHDNLIAIQHSYSHSKVIFDINSPASLRQIESTIKKLCEEPLFWSDDKTHTKPIL